MEKRLAVSSEVLEISKLWTSTVDSDALARRMPQAIDPRYRSKLSAFVILTPDNSVKVVGRFEKGNSQTKIDQIFNRSIRQIDDSATIYIARDGVLALSDFAAWFYLPDSLDQTESSLGWSHSCT
jgi:hypothetical protein